MPAGADFAVHALAAFDRVTFASEEEREVRLHPNNSLSLNGFIVGGEG